MGFGILFIGYFFLINPSYFQYTDIIGAAVMLLGLYKLSRYDRSFFRATISAAIFFIISLGELAVSLLDMIIGASDAVYYLYAARYISVLVLTVFILLGIRSIASEVEADELAARAKLSLPLTAIFGAAAILEIPIFNTLGEGAALVLGWVAFTVLLASVVFVVNTLIIIYRAYMQICLPEQLHRSVKGKGGFMDKYWSHLESGAKEYAEYRQSRRAAKKEKRKK
jgi:hypothetical protein